MDIMLMCGVEQSRVVDWAVLQLMYLVSTMTSKFLVCGR